MAELDRRTIKALASDTRVDILKSLGARRKMPSELAREHSLAASTIVEHLKILEHSGLIRRVETGHKWTYYELTRKGQELAAPRLPVQHVIVLGLGLLLVFGSLNFFQAMELPFGGKPGSVTSEHETGAAPPPRTVITGAPDAGASSAGASSAGAPGEALTGTVNQTLPQEITQPVGAGGGAGAAAPLPNLVDPQVSVLLLGIILSLYGGWKIWKSN